MTDPLAYNIAASAIAIGVSESTIRAALARGDLVRRYVGKVPVIEVGELRAWLKSLPTQAPQT